MSEYQDLSQQIELIATAEESEQTHLLGEMVENGLDEGSIALILEAFPVEQRVRFMAQFATGDAHRCANRDARRGADFGH